MLSVIYKYDLTQGAKLFLPRNFKILCMTKQLDRQVLYIQFNVNEIETEEYIVRVVCTGEEFVEPDSSWFLGTVMSFEDSYVEHYFLDKNVV